MQALAEASTVGFGTRCWTGSPAEIHTLDLALDRGCSLVDVTADDARADVERAVGRVLSRRLDDVTVVTLCASLEPSAVAGRARVAAGRLRRDRVDVLLLDEPGHHLADPADAEPAVRAAFETCEALVDRGELGWYGVSSARLNATATPQAPLGLDRLLAIARSIRADHRFGVLQVPCEVLTGPSSTGRPVGRPVGRRGSMVRQARLGGLRTIGTGPVPMWVASGAAPLATCRALLMDGVDHVLVDPANDEQVLATLEYTTKGFGSLPTPATLTTSGA